jgi:hypothetical protein
MNHSYIKSKLKKYCVTVGEWSYHINAISISTKDGAVEVYIDDYPNCCGSYEMFALETIASIDTAIQLVKDVIDAVLEVEHKNHVTYISLEEGQEEVNEVLTGVGFKQVDTFRNSNTANQCILWSLNSAV